jgi:competence protein ComFB
MKFKNYMEDVVQEVFLEFLNTHQGYCTCERCKVDTITYALNKLKGKYAVTPEGEIFVKLARDDRQVRADAMIVIIEAAEQVAKNPKHD